MREGRGEGDSWFGDAAANRRFCFLLPALLAGAADAGLRLLLSFFSSRPSPEHHAANRNEAFSFFLPLGLLAGANVGCRSSPFLFSLSSLRRHHGIDSPSLLLSSLRRHHGIDSPALLRSSPPHRTTSSSSPSLAAVLERQPLVTPDASRSLGEEAASSSTNTAPPPFLDDNVIRNIVDASSRCPLPRLHMATTGHEHPQLARVAALRHFPLHTSSCRRPIHDFR